MSRDTAVPKKTVLAVWERDGESCANCGQGLRFEGRGYEWSLHHRVPRGVGGSKASWINAPSNLVVLCGSGTTGCHGHFESHRAEAESVGLIVRRGVLLPALVPVMHRGVEKWLTDTGLLVDVGAEPNF